MLRFGRMALSAIFMLFAPAAVAGAAFTYEGVLERDNGQGRFTAESGPKSFVVEIDGFTGSTTNPCVLYSETQNVTLVDGHFSFKVGTGTGASIAAGKTFTELFSPRTSIAGISSCTFNTQDAAARWVLRIRDVSTSDVLGDVELTSAPRAMVADSLAGYSAADFLKLDPTSNLTQANVASLFSTTTYTTLTDLASGHSSLYVEKNASGLVAPSYTNAPPSSAAGSLWYDSTNNVMKYYDGIATVTLGPQGDGFSQYALLAGRNSNQTLRGGTASNGSLILDSTSSSTKGSIVLAPNGGNVGIGTTNPQAVLDVTSNGGGPSAIIVPRDTISNRPTPAIPGMIRYNTDSQKFEAFENSGWTDMINAGSGGASGGANAIQVNNGSGNFSANSNVVVNSTTGFVGVGTTTPWGNLEVYGTGSSSTTSAIVATMVGFPNNPLFMGRQARGTATAPAVSRMGDTLVAFGGIGYDGVNSDFSSVSMVSMRFTAAEDFSSSTHATQIDFTTTSSNTAASAPRMRIDKNGDVGINTTSPSERLHVVGNLRVQGSTDCTLGNGSGGTSCSSDIRLKTNIREIENPLEKILALRGVEFDWNEKSQSPGRHSIGVIAQDVEKQFPTAVMNDTSTGYEKVDYAVLVAPLIQAVKELFGMVQENSADIASMKSDNARLKTEVSRLKNQNESLQRWICSKDPSAQICR